MLRIFPLVLAAILSMAVLPVHCSREVQAPTVVGVMYHHWWVPERWMDDPPNYPYQPLLGKYDNADPAVIQQHIDWAKQYGINTFVLNFWLTDHDWGWVNRNTLALADMCDAQGINYFFLMDGWFTFEDRPDQVEEIVTRSNARAAPFFERPGYLKVDGRPVVFFWAAEGSDPAMWPQVRAGIEAKAGPIFMTGNLWDVFDLRMMYNPYISNTDNPDKQLAHQEHLWSTRSKTGRPWAPTALPGYDDHMVRDGNAVVPLEPELFRKSLRTAMRYDQNHGTGERWLFVCSWSEWHEGSQIEPSSDFEDPEVFLKVLKEELDALAAE